MKTFMKNGLKKTRLKKSDGINNAVEEPILGVTLFKRVLNYYITLIRFIKIDKFHSLIEKVIKIIKLYEKVL